MIKRSIGILACLLLVFASGCNSTSAPKTTRNSLAASATTTETALTSIESASDLATDSPASTDTLQTDDTTTTAPTDTPQPSDSATPAPTDTPQPSDSAAPAPTDTPAPTTATITVKPVIGKANVTSYLPLRSTASIAAASVVKIPKKATFTVIEVSTDAAWLKVKYSGKTGYVLAKYVIIGSKTAYRACTITSATLNVRDGADTKHAVITILKTGKTLIVTAQVSTTTGMWYKVIVGKQTGYVAAKYCRLSTN